MNMAELQALVITDVDRDWKEFGDVSAKIQDGLILFNYTPAAQFSNRWNWFERVSRGLILSTQTGEVVARPFDKFFNYGERGRYPAGHLVSVTEKLDGSLGILYRMDGDFRIATRGSFESEQAVWATDALRLFDLNAVPEELTLLFEIIYPDNRVVVDYGAREDLVLLAVRNRFTGDYLPFNPDVMSLADALDFDVPTVYGFNSAAEIAESCHWLTGVEQEGYVAEFSDGSRFKFKGDEYVELHRLVTNLSFNRVVEAFRDGKLEEYAEAIPDEFMGPFREYVDEIQGKVNDIILRVNDAMAHAYKEGVTKDRKTFALFVNQEYRDLSSYLFATKDGKDILPIIFRREF